MYSGSFSITDSVDRLDLQATLESAQSFLWQRVDGGCTRRQLRLVVITGTTRPLRMTFSSHDSNQAD